MTFALRPAAIAAAAALLACGGKGPDGSVSYAVTAPANYEKGEKELKEKDWVAAAKYFAFIKARFAFSKFAVLSELRLADAEFGAEHYVQAIDRYKLFIKFHPTHQMVVNGYAMFRIGECYYKMLPTSFWLLPPAHEKDQSATYDASRQLQLFIRKYPSSPYLAKAKEMLAKVHKRLAQHEWYVAKFYWDRGKAMATVLRLRRLLREFSGVGYDGDALWLLGKAYVKVKMAPRAKEAWQRLVDKYPRHKRAPEAKRALAGLPG